ncbi:hypothetical protein BG55_05390 [Erwinia mallotivora]|uniref:Uncharacterized protein n=1 Tax=Erwinia mallotivora TaxID=69222 RepID=A0A014NAQ8_9GAMM|nr:hypothetical protein BG55_05390 [Erwinia mallotivora]
MFQNYLVINPAIAINFKIFLRNNGSDEFSSIQIYWRFFSAHQKGPLLSHPALKIINSSLAKDYARQFL